MSAVTTDPETTERDVTEKQAEGTGADEEYDVPMPGGLRGLV